MPRYNFTMCFICLILIDWLIDWSNFNLQCEVFLSNIPLTENIETNLKMRHKVLHLVFKIFFFKLFNFWSVANSYFIFWTNFPIFQPFVYFWLTLSRGGGFLLNSLKMAYMRTLKFLYFFYVENGQTAGWCLKNQKWLITVL